MSEEKKKMEIVEIAPSFISFFSPRVVCGLEYLTAACHILVCVYSVSKKEKTRIHFPGIRFFWHLVQQYLSFIFIFRYTTSWAAMHQAKIRLYNRESGYIKLNKKSRKYIAK